MKWNFSVAFAFGLFFLSILTISFFFFGCKVPELKKKNYVNRLARTDTEIQMYLNLKRHSCGYNKSIYAVDFH